VTFGLTNLASIPKLRQAKGHCMSLGESTATPDCAAYAMCLPLNVIMDMKSNRLILEYDVLTY